jgi:hypothetical protein
VALDEAVKAPDATRPLEALSPGGDVKIRLSHIAMTCSANAEAWVRRENGNWRVSEVLAHWRNL